MSWFIVSTLVLLFSASVGEVIVDDEELKRDFHVVGAEQCNHIHLEVRIEVIHAKDSMLAIDDKPRFLLVVVGNRQQLEFWRQFLSCWLECIRR